MLNLMGLVRLQGNKVHGRRLISRKPRWVVISEHVEQSPAEKKRKAFRVIKTAEHINRSQYDGAILRAIRARNGVGRPKFLVWMKAQGLTS